MLKNTNELYDNVSRCYFLKLVRQVVVSVVFMCVAFTEDFLSDQLQLRSCLMTVLTSHFSVSTSALVPLGCWEPRVLNPAGEGAASAVPSVPVPAST